MTNHELEAVNQLALYVLVFGFFTGIFFSHRIMDFIEFAFRVVRMIKRKRKRAGGVPAN